MVNILGINISDYKKPEILAKIVGFLSSDSQHYIVTPNPEIILRASHEDDEELFYILNKADLAIADGVGLKFASWLQDRNLPRLTGADLTLDLLQLAQAQKMKVLVINWDGGLSKKMDIAAALHRRYPDLDFLIKDEPRDYFISEEDTELKKYGAQIMLVALGAPYQEKFIWHNLKKLPAVKVAIGIGGALDFLTGKIKRAPKIMRAAGLEWLWRLIKQPQKRARRIYNATWIFTKEALRSRFILPWIYRKNVACLLYKNDNGNYKILLVERTEGKGHWQLPQGGTDGLDLKTAGLKELSEELNLPKEKFAIRAVMKNLYKYTFDKGLGKYKNPQRHLGYKGQCQSLIIAEFLGDLNEPRVNFWDHQNYKWVDANNLINEVHELRKPSAKIYLEKFKELI